MLFIAYALLIATQTIGAESDDSGIKLNRESVDIDIRHRYAVVTYSFNFTNIGDSPQQLDYQLSLDPNAFISHFIGQIDGQKYKGVTKAKATAKQEYTKACKENKNAILVSQDHDANQFSIKTNLKPKSTAILNVTVEQLMVRYFGYYELSLDISNINRYSSASPQIPINIQLCDKVVIEEIDVPFGTYDVDKETENHHTIRALISKPDNDKPSYFILRYKTAVDERDSDRNQMLFDPKSNTFLHTFSDDSDKHQVLPRRVVFVLDKSGSMWGVWEQAQEAIIGAISNLQIEIDRFGVVLFSSDIQQEAIKLADNSNTVRQATAFVKRTQPGGATNLYGALVAAIQMVTDDMKQTKQQCINQIILVTDGQANVGVVDDNEILNQITRRNPSDASSKISIFGIAISEDTGMYWAQNLNYPLIRRLSIQNGGFDKRVKKSDTKRDLQKYYALLQSPQLSEIRIGYQSEAHEIKTLTETKFDTLYKGSDIVIAGKVEPKDEDTRNELKLSTKLSAKTVTKDVEIPKVFDLSVRTSDNIVDIERIWAYLQLKQYEELLLRMQNSIEWSEVMQELIDEKALEMALRYQFVTQWTSMIVVEQKPHKMIDVNRDHRIKAGDPTAKPILSAAPGPTIRHNMHPDLEIRHPTIHPTLSPAFSPTDYPTNYPVPNPTANPTSAPTSNPIFDPLSDPTRDPTAEPTRDPTYEPTSDPTIDPTADPTHDPIYDPTSDPTSDPTRDPTTDPTDPTMVATEYDSENWEEGAWITEEDTAALLAVEIHATYSGTGEIDIVRSEEMDEAYTVEEISNGEFLYEFVGLEALRQSDGNSWVKDIAKSVLNQLNHLSIYKSCGNSVRTFDCFMNVSVFILQFFVMCFCISF